MIVSQYFINVKFKYALNIFQISTLIRKSTTYKFRSAHKKYLYIRVTLLRQITPLFFQKICFLSILTTYERRVDFTNYSCLT